MPATAMIGKLVGMHATSPSITPSAETQPGEACQQVPGSDYKDNRKQSEYLDRALSSSHRPRLMWPMLGQGVGCHLV